MVIARSISSGWTPGVYSGDGEFVRPGFGEHLARECQRKHSAGNQHHDHEHINQDRVFDAETGNGHEVAIILGHGCGRRCGIGGATAYYRQQITVGTFEFRIAGGNYQN